MQGISVSQMRAYEFSEHFDIYLSPSTGFWIKTDDLSKIYRTDDTLEIIPGDAFRFEFEMTLEEASQTYPLAYSTLAQYAREGKLDARKSGGAWLTTRRAIERLLNHSLA